jgi:hypothetical protein
MWHGESCHNFDTNLGSPKGNASPPVDIDVWDQQELFLFQVASLY